MGKYQITMDYLEFQRLEKAKSDFMNLKKELSECIEHYGKAKPIADTKKLKTIALRYTNYRFEESEVVDK